MLCLSSSSNGVELPSLGSTEEFVVYYVTNKVQFVVSAYALYIFQLKYS